MSNTFEVQEIWLHDKRYLLLEGGSIVDEDWAGETGYAHLNEDGSVMRHGAQIARVSDIQFGGMVTLDGGLDLLAGMLETILGQP